MDPHINAPTEAPMRRLLTVEETAEFLGVPVRTLYQWRYRRTGPPVLRVGRHLRYRPADLESWIEELRRSSAR